MFCYLKIWCLLLCKIVCKTVTVWIWNASHRLNTFEYLIPSWWYCLGASLEETGHWGWGMRALVYFLCSLSSDCGSMLHRHAFSAVMGCIPLNYKPKHSSPKLLVVRYLLSVMRKVTNRPNNTTHTITEWSAHSDGWGCVPLTNLS